MALPDLPSTESYPDLPGAGRTFTGTHRCQLGDVDSAGRLRPDALARVVQDLGTADTVDADLHAPGTWVLRKAEFAADPSPRLYETVELTTFCTGTGSRWAERTTRISGDAGGVAAMRAVWVYVSREHGAPIALPDSFIETYRRAADGRTVSSRLSLPKRPPTDRPVSSRPWPSRQRDFDILDHVNNAVYWEAGLDAAAAACPPTSTGVVTIVGGQVDYRDAIERDDAASLVWETASVDSGDGGSSPLVDVVAWLVSDRASHATVRLRVSPT